MRVHDPETLVDLETIPIAPNKSLLINVVETVVFFVSIPGSRAWKMDSFETSKTRLPTLTSLCVNKGVIILGDSSILQAFIERIHSLETEAETFLAVTSVLCT